MRLIDNHLRRALDYVRPYWGALVPVVLVSILSTGLSLVLPYLSKVLVDDAILGRDLRLLFQIVGLVIAIPLVSFGLNVFSGMRYTGVSADILFDMRLDLYRHLQRLSPRYYARTPLGDIVTRINGDIGEIQRVVSEAALSWFGQVIALIGTVGMLIYLDWQLFVASLVVMPPSLYTLVRYRSELETRITKLREKSSQIGSFLIETLQGMRTVVGANAQGREIERFRNRNDAFVEALLSMRLYTYVAGGLPGLLLTAGTALIFLLGGYRVIDGTMSLGTLVAFMAYQARLMAPVQGLMGIYTNLATARASLVRVHEVLDERPDVSQVSEPKLMETCRGEIQLQGISFDFGRGVGGLSQVDIKIPAGQIVAIVGESGCGKSTLADLLERHFDPQEGQVLLDGVPMSTLLLKDVRRHVSVVPQDPFICHASVIDNVRYADPKATDEKVRAAVDAAGLTPLLELLPDGLHTLVGERGRQLSAGERQRLAIARAFLADPAVIVMDEATGALDPSSEAAVLEGYERVMKGRTTILITHRLELARKAERVIVIEDGRIAEDGSPELLEAEGATFRELFIDVR